MYRYQQGISPYKAVLTRSDLCKMIALVRVLYHLSEQSAYRQLIAPERPVTARFDPGHDSVMMGYDFHLGETGPQLIEINTNNGGAWLACQACRPEITNFPEQLGKKIVATFVEDFRAWKKDPLSRLQHVVIMDEQPDKQFLYQEMQVFAELFRKMGINANIVDPGNLNYLDEGVFFRGNKIDLIYNRHCDFYLETADMADIRSAWSGRTVCLTPNPHTYGLLADKRRLVLWSDPDQRVNLGLNEKQEKLVASMVPRTLPMNSLPVETVWQNRKQWVFKPVTSYGCKGVYVGKKLTKKKFSELDPEATLIQRLVPPSVTHTANGDSFKTDFRLFVYRNRVQGITARLYRGQVTNLHTEGGGFAALEII